MQKLWIAIWVGHVRLGTEVGAINEDFDENKFNWFVGRIYSAE